MPFDAAKLAADTEAFCRELRPHEELCYAEHRFNDQLVPEVPHGPSDQRLDWLLTDKRACAFV